MVYIFVLYVTPETDRYYILTEQHVRCIWYVHVLFTTAEIIENLCWHMIVKRVWAELLFLIQNNMNNLANMNNNLSYDIFGLSLTLEKETFSFTFFNMVSKLI